MYDMQLVDKSCKQVLKRTKFIKKLKLKKKKKTEHWMYFFDKKD